MFILKKRSNAKRKGGVEECLQRIELEANDDLRMVLEFGPQHFTTHELHGMLRKLNEQSRYILRLRDRLLPSILLLFIVPAIVLFGTLKWKSLHQLRRLRSGLPPGSGVYQSIRHHCSAYALRYCVYGL